MSEDRSEAMERRGRLSIRCQGDSSVTGGRRLRFDSTSWVPVSPSFPSRRGSVRRSGRLSSHRYATPGLLPSPTAYKALLRDLAEAALHLLHQAEGFVEVEAIGDAFYVLVHGLSPSPQGLLEMRPQRPVPLSPGVACRYALQASRMLLTFGVEAEPSGSCRSAVVSSSRMLRMLQLTYSSPSSSIGTSAHADHLARRRGRA